MSSRKHYSRKEEIKDEFSPASRNANTPNATQRRGRILQQRPTVPDSLPQPMITRQLCDKYYHILLDQQYPPIYNRVLLPKPFNFQINRTLFDLFKKPPGPAPDPDTFIFNLQLFNNLCMEYIRNYLGLGIVSRFRWRFLLISLNFNTIGYDYFDPFDREKVFQITFKPNWYPQDEIMIFRKEHVIPISATNIYEWQQNMFRNSFLTYSVVDNSWIDITEDGTSIINYSFNTTADTHNPYNGYFPYFDTLPSSELYETVLEYFCLGGNVGDPSSILKMNMMIYAVPLLIS